jgi:hypothetical protein
LFMASPSTPLVFAPVDLAAMTAVTRECDVRDELFE